MNMVDRKARAVLIAMLLGCGGVAMGAFASNMTTDSLAWRAPSREAATAAPVASAIDQASAGQAWARSAFDGGLRRCPPMNDAFLAACEAEMKQLAERPAFSAGSYGGPPVAAEDGPVAHDGWDAQDRLERPRLASYASQPEAAPDEPAVEGAPDDYPATVEPEPAPIRGE